MITSVDLDIIVIDENVELRRAQIKDNNCFRIRAIPNSIFTSKTLLYHFFINVSGFKIAAIEDFNNDYREPIREAIKVVFNSKLIEANQYLKSLNVTLNFQFEVLYPEEVTAIVEEEA